MSGKEIEYEIARELEEESVAAPSVAHAYVSIGYRAMIESNPRKAILALEKAGQLQPDSAAPHQFLGLVYADQGENERAVEHFRKCIELGCKRIDPVITEENPYYHMGWCLEDLGKVTEATEIYHVGIERVPLHYGTYFRLGRLYHQQKRHELAVEIYSEALKVSSEDDPNRFDPRLFRNIEHNLTRARRKQPYQEHTHG